MHKSKIVVFVVCVLLGFSCTALEKIKSERLGTDKVVIPSYGNRFELYYGAQTVGWCDYIQKAVEYSDTDVDYQERFEEEITFRGVRYKFKFVLYVTIAELHVLRYNTNGQGFQPNESYAIIRNSAGVFYRYFKEDGQEVLREVQIRDPQKVANTDELFRYCDSYLSSYFALVKDKKGRKLRNNRIQSLGYELLQFERL